MREFVFWQRNLSPHSVPLAIALARLGHRVTVVVHTLVTQERRALGWKDAELVDVHQAVLSASTSDQVIQQLVAPGAVHILQGLPRKGVLKRVQRILSNSGVLWGSMMEQVDDRGWRGVIKRREYAYRLKKHDAPKFVLGIGERAQHWFSMQSACRIPVYPFAYFLASSDESLSLDTSSMGVPRVGFLGQFIQRKRFDILVEALAHPSLHGRRTLVCAGNGPLQAMQLDRAIHKLGSDGVEFVGVVPLEKVPSWIASLDVLVLPSDFDGWGAVVSEALMCGVPVICSDACGACTVVRSGGPLTGDVFKRGDQVSLVEALGRFSIQGATAQIELAQWAKNCLNSQAGATYLLRVLDHIQRPGGRVPLVPWQECKFPSHSALTESTSN